MKENPKAYDYDWAGACKPGGREAFNSITFSVGVFQWLPKSSGKGLKRGKVIKRIKGYSAKPEEVYKQADQLCKEFDSHRARNLKARIKAGLMEDGK